MRAERISRLIVQTKAIYGCGRTRLTMVYCGKYNIYDSTIQCERCQTFSIIFLMDGETARHTNMITIDSLFYRILYIRRLKNVGYVPLSLYKI